MEGDEELEKLRAKKIKELQYQQQAQQQAQEQQQQFEAVKQNVLRQILTPEARERLGRMKVGRPDIAAMVEEQLISLAQSGRLGSQIDDNMLKMILDKVIPKKRDIQITRK